MLKRNKIFVCGIMALLFVGAIATADHATDVLAKRVQDIQVVRSEPYEKAISPVVESIQYSGTSASKGWTVTSEHDSKGYSTGVWLTRIDTKTKRRLIEPSTLDVRWSPVRDEFLCNIITLPISSPGWNVGTLWLVDTAGAKRQLYKWGGGLHWSPDGEKIMLASVAYSGGGVVVVDRFGKILFEEDSFTGDDPGGVWAPDSRHIAYSRGKVKGSNWEMIKSDVIIADIATGEKKVLIQNPEGTWDQPLQWRMPNRILISREILQGNGPPKQYLYWVLK